jgi:hypothetical protein
MNVRVVKEYNLNIKEIRTRMKVRDTFECQVVNNEGKVELNYDGYVPSFFPDDHYGDYLYLNIDIETGQILNWKKPTEEQLANFIKYA